MSEKFGTYGEIISGYAFKSAELHDVDDIPVIKIGNISNGGNVVFGNGTQYVGKEFLEKIDEKFIVNNGDVLISLTGSHINQPNSMVGRSCRYLFDTPALLNQRAGKVFPKENADGLYLYYLIHSDYFIQNIGVRAYGAANQANVSPNDIKKIKWNFPDLPTQNHIADILSAYDSAIENNNRRIDLLEKAAQELYKEWFVRFRFPGHESARFVNGLPEGWTVKRMATFTHVTDGTHDTPKQTDAGVSLVTGRCISNGFIDFDSAYLISEVDHAGISKRSGLETGDILFSNIGTVGSTCIVDYYREFSVKNVIIFKPESEAKTTYLYLLLTSQSMQDIFQAQTNGASQQFVGLTFMRRFKIVVPSEELLLGFSERVSSLLAERQLLHKKSQNLALQRDMLLPRLMSGKLEV